MEAPWHPLWIGWTARPNHLPPDRQAMTEEPASVAGPQGLADAAADATGERNAYFVWRLWPMNRSW